MQLVEKKKQMREKMKTLKSEEMHDYIEMDELLKTLHEIMEMVINSHLIRFLLLKNLCVDKNKKTLYYTCNDKLVYGENNEAEYFKIRTN